MQRAGQCGAFIWEQILGKRQLALEARRYHISSMSDMDRSDYSVVVKLRANPPKPWRWEIYCAGKSHPIKHSSVTFTSMAAAHKAGKEALRELLDKIFARPARTLKSADLQTG